MRVLFTTVPAFGHFHPLVPLAEAAVARGDEVLVATGPELAGWVPACGLAYAAAGMSGRQGMAEARERFPGAMTPFHGFTTVLVPPMVRDLLELGNEWRPDLIIHEETEYATPLAARLLGVRCVTHSYAAPARPEDERAIMHRLLEPIWAQYGAGLAQESGDVYLDACPPAFQTAAVASIPGVRSIRPVAFDGPASGPPERLAAIERPTAYVSFGTIPVFARAEVIARAVDAARTVVASVVVTTGPNPITIVEATKDVIVEQYLPQSSVLSHVDVVVSHGGAGTTLGALLAGLPHVVVPQQTMSQLRNAQRIEALGIGVHVPQDAPSDAIADAVRTVLTDPSYAARATEISHTLSQLPSPDVVLSELLDPI
jgi:UDP:flavonoid glycosyltransferase YjiC (YdhE family)